MRLPITTWQDALLWLMSGILLGFAWHVGTRIASAIFRG
jgi:hypothetical protein